MNYKERKEESDREMRKREKGLKLGVRLASMGFVIGLITIIYGICNWCWQIILISVCSLILAYIAFSLGKERNKER